jgi:hypothetical protein
VRRTKREIAHLEQKGILRHIFGIN